MLLQIVNVRNHIAGYYPARVRSRGKVIMFLLLDSVQSITAPYLTNFALISNVKKVIFVSPRFMKKLKISNCTVLYCECLTYRIIIN